MAGLAITEGDRGSGLLASSPAGGILARLLRSRRRRAVANLGVTACLQLDGSRLFA